MDLALGVDQSGLVGGDFPTRQRHSKKWLIPVRRSLLTTRGNHFPPPVLVSEPVFRRA
jgi:hypothetical protein